MPRVREKRGRPLIGVDGEVCAKRIQKGPKKMNKGLDRAGILRDVRLRDFPGADKTNPRIAL
jgi:hypothetical protein